jgi:methionyl-tRNA formyltransferase
VRYGKIQIPGSKVTPVIVAECKDKSFACVTSVQFDGKSPMAARDYIAGHKCARSRPVSFDL